MRELYLSTTAKDSYNKYSIMKNPRSKKVLQ